MPAYSYKAMDAAGRIVVGRLDAVNSTDLEQRLLRMGLDFIDGAPAGRLGRRAGAVPRRQLIGFCFHLEQLIQAGVPIVECLADLSASVSHPRWREVLAGMVESIGGGNTLSQAMAEHPRTFDEVMVGLIRSGEDSGKLPEVLGNLVAALKWQDELVSHARKLALYPAFLGFVVAALVFFMMIYLVPKMVGFMSAMGQQLPLHTEILIAVSGIFVRYWELALILPVAVGAALGLAVRRNPQIRLSCDRAKLRLPVLGAILHKIVLARFAATFAMLYGAGISILDAVRTCENIVGNTAVAASLRRAGTLISDGENVAGAFQQVGLFPPLVIRMLRVGENTGALDRALSNVGYFYSRDVRESVERVQAAVEPAMTVAIGLVMGWIMLSMLGPIYDVITRLKT